MKFREANQVKWVGVRPGHRGTQIVKYKVANNNLQIIHTVDTDMIFYLCGWSLVGERNVSGYGYLFVRDDEDAVQYIISYLKAYTGVAGPHVAVGYYFPIEIPAGWDIVVESKTVGLSMSAFIYGWEEPE